MCINIDNERQPSYTKLVFNGISMIHSSYFPVRHKVVVRPWLNIYIYESQVISYKTICLNGFGHSLMTLSLDLLLLELYEVNIIVIISQK